MSPDEREAYEASFVAALATYRRPVVFDPVGARCIVADPGGAGGEADLLSFGLYADLVSSPLALQKAVGELLPRQLAIDVAEGRVNPRTRRAYAMEVDVEKVEREKAGGGGAASAAAPAADPPSQESLGTALASVGDGSSPALLGLTPPEAEMAVEQAGTQAETQPQTQPQTQDETQPQTQPQTQDETQPQTQDEAETQPQIQPQMQDETQTQPQTQPQTQDETLAAPPPTGLRGVLHRLIQSASFSND